jgi:hypothetical protein
MGEGAPPAMREINQYGAPKPVEQPLDHAAIGRNRPIAENVIDSKSLERAYSEKPASAFSQRALERIPQKLVDFCDKNALKLFGLARFLVARTIPFSGKRAEPGLGPTVPTLEPLQTI